MQQDLILKQRNLPSFQDVILDGNNHTIYATKEIIISWNQCGITFQNVCFQEIDHVLPIQNFSDLENILKYPNDRFVAYLTQNFKQKWIKSSFIRRLLWNPYFTWKRICIKSCAIKK